MKKLLSSLLAGALLLAPASAQVRVSPPNSGQYPGVPTNTAAAAGNIGELLSCSVVLGSAVALTNNAAADVCTFSLTPGEWDVTGVVAFSPAGTTTTTREAAGISTTTATLPAALGTGSGQLEINSYQAGIATTAGFPGPMAILGPTRLSVASGSTTPIFLEALATFAVSTDAAYGFMRATRVH